MAGVVARESRRIKRDGLRPTFLAWLDGKMEGQTGKLIPPAAVLTRRLVADTRDLFIRGLVDEVIRGRRR